MKNLSLNFLKLSSIVLATSYFLISCGPSAEEMSSKESKAKEFANAVSTKIDAIPIKTVRNDSTRSFVRKADLFFKVKDVKQSTFDIERIVNEHKGYVTTSDLESQLNYKNSIRISKDSMQDLTNFTVKSNILVRIPNTELDATLTQIAGLIDYLEYRKIQIDDVTKQFQSAKLSEKRFEKHKHRLEKSIDTKGQKLNQLVEAENDLVEKQEIADNTQINTLELIHDVTYSTVSISIYQKETTKTETYAVALPIEPYKPNFGAKLLPAITEGAAIFGEIILFFIRLWPIAILIMGVVFLIKLIARRKWFGA